MNNATSEDTIRVGGQANRARADSRRSECDGRSSTSAVDPVAAAEQLLAELADMKRHVRFYAAFQLAALKERVRQAAFLGGVAILFTVVLSTLVIAATVQMAQGLARAFTAAFPVIHWAGPLLSGVSLLAIVAVGLVLARAWLRRSALRDARSRAQEWRQADGNRRDTSPVNGESRAPREETADERASPPGLEL